MHDHFLQRLRKDPSPEFATRLRERLRRQSGAALTRRAPSTLRTLIVALLFGGAAFAATYAVVRGMPQRLQAGASRWLTSAERPASVTEAAHIRPSATSAAAAATPLGASPAAPALVPLATATQTSLQMPIVSSWSAYPYADAIAARVNAVTSGANALTGGTAPTVVVRASELWQELMCRARARGPVIAYAFRAVSSSSGSLCEHNGSGPRRGVVGIRLGYEAVFLARSRLYGALDLTLRDVYLALARWVPDPMHPGSVVENASTTWRQVDPALPLDPIEFIGPPLDSATGRSMIDLLIEDGCDTYGWIAALRSSDPERHARICRSVRSDGSYHQVFETASVSPERLLAQPNAVGVFGFDGYLGQVGLGGLSISRLDAVEPSRQAVESGAYPGARALYLYIDRARAPLDITLRLLVNDSLQPLLAGRGGEWALVPLPEPERRAALFAALAR